MEGRYCTLKLIKLFHYVGCTMFSGSILTFLAISTLTKNASLDDLVFARQIISAGTTTLTLPGMWMIVITGVLMTVRTYGFFKYTWLNLKHLIIVTVVLNAHLIIVPTADSALHMARLSLAHVTLLSYYNFASSKESVFGAFNVLMILFSIFVGIWNIGN